MSIGPTEIVIICGILALLLAVVGGVIALVVVLARRN
jgi:hypothetical protein